MSLNDYRALSLIFLGDQCYREETSVRTNIFFFATHKMLFSKYTNVHSLINTLFHASYFSTKKKLITTHKSDTGFGKLVWFSTFSF